MRSLVIAFVLTTAIGVAGCAAPTSSDESTAKSEEALTFKGSNYFSGWNDSGFYTVDGGPAVYLITGSSYCWVYDPGQLDVLSHNAYTASYARPENLVTTGDYGGVNDLKWRQYNGYCSYPDGMYRRSDQNEVYLVTGSTLCWVRNSDQVNNHGGWDRVTVISRPDDEAKFQDFRTLTGYCAY